MYVIQTGNKFLKPSTAYRSFYDITVSETPKFLKTLSEAKAHLAAIQAQIDNSISRFEQQLAAEGKKVAQELARIPKLQAKLDALKELPYKEVYKKIPRAEQELKQASWYKTANSLATWQRDIARLERIRNGNLRIVKMQQELVDI